MKNLEQKVNEIKTIINNNGGVSNYPNKIKRNRPIGCPMRCNTIDEVRFGLTNQEYYIAFALDLIGNNGHTGKIIKNCMIHQYTINA